MPDEDKIFSGSLDLMTSRAHTLYHVKSTEYLSEFLKTISKYHKTISKYLEKAAKYLLFSF